ncbi:hypothetical protein KCU93_g483, partial [Aureobasidium melanogenum]
MTFHFARLKCSSCLNESAYPVDFVSTRLSINSARKVAGRDSANQRGFGTPPWPNHNDAVVSLFARSCYNIDRCPVRWTPSKNVFMVLQECDNSLIMSLDIMPDVRVDDPRVLIIAVLGMSAFRTSPAWQALSLAVFNLWHFRVMSSEKTRMFSTNATCCKVLYPLTGILVMILPTGYNPSSSAFLLLLFL